MSEEVCCAQTSESDPPICPRTGRATLLVERRTVLGHVQDGDVPDSAFGFCDTPTCSTVYVSADGQLIDKADLRTRVGIKETDDPIPVCYCFNFTERQIVEDVRDHGRSTIREYIAGEVVAGNCRCTLTNPSGRCCLGSVGRVIAKASGGSAGAHGAAGGLDGGATGRLSDGAKGDG